MAKQAFLCKYAEIGIKGKNRYKFENALCEQIRRRLAKVDGEFTVILRCYQYYIFFII